MNIYGKKVFLRAMCREDAEIMVKMFNDPEIEYRTGGWAFPLSVDQQNKWFESHMNDADKRLMIVAPEIGTIGMIRLSDINWKDRSCTIGFKLADAENRGKGYGTDAYMAVIRYAFDELGMHRINASYSEENGASRAVHKKCGFREEGLMRDTKFSHGKWQSFCVAGLLEQDYRELIAQNHYWD